MGSAGQPLALRWFSWALLGSAARVAGSGVSPLGSPGHPPAPTLRRNLGEHRLQTAFQRAKLWLHGATLLYMESQLRDTAEILKMPANYNVGKNTFLKEKVIGFHGVESSTQRRTQRPSRTCTVASVGN